MSDFNDNREKFNFDTDPIVEKADDNNSLSAQTQDGSDNQLKDEIAAQPHDEIADELAADDLNDEDIIGGKTADCKVKDLTDTKTNSAATKKEKVSFKIEGLDDANKEEEAFTSKDINTKKARLTPSMLKRMKTLLLQKIHCSGKDDFYIGDLIDAVEGELMNLPKKRRRKRSSKKESIKLLTKNKIRSFNFQRRNICLNMQILSSSMHAEFKNMDETLTNLRQASNDFNAEFNQPHTPIGEPNAASVRMNELFLKIKDNLPNFQDCFKEVKHCSRLFIKADMTLTDNLYNTIQAYFGERLKGELIPRVHYSEVLKIFMNSNRQHCHLALHANAMDETSDTSLDQDKI